MHIQLCDLKANYLSIKDDIDSAIARVIDNSSYIMGKEVASFEKNYAEYCGTKHCIGVSNATSGLFLALKAIDIEPGDEVILPTFTVTADIEAVIMAGGTPVLCDTNENGNITIDEIKRNITEKTVAIICVHMFGIPCDIKLIKEFADAKGIYVIEDCSHAHGASVDGKRLGSIGDIGVFSFFPSKVLGSFGDAGAVVTNIDEYATKIRALRDHGRMPKAKYTHEYAGYNMRLDGLQAAILNAKLPHLDNFVNNRRKIAKYYYDVLNKKVNAIYNENSANYIFAIRVKDRDKLAEYLKENEISTGVHYPVPIHKQPFYERDYGKMMLPVSEQLASEVLSLPMYPELDTVQQIYIINSVNRWFLNND